MADDHVWVPQSTSKRGGGDAPASKMRACLQCNLILTEDQFIDFGCPNCGSSDHDKTREAVQVTTTNHFKGVGVILRPEVSWVARFHEINGVVGAYALNQ